MKLAGINKRNKDIDKRLKKAEASKKSLSKKMLLHKNRYHQLLKQKKH